MTELNISAIASVAFLGFLALAALLFCVPPVTRFLGDLFCCPWRVPFTRKRRRNDDEEVDKEDLPYWADPRPSTPANDTAYQSMPDAYLSAQGTRGHGNGGAAFRDDPARMIYADVGQGLDSGYYGESYHDRQAPFPQSHSRDWWRSPTDEYPEYVEYTEHQDPEYPGQAMHGYRSALDYPALDNYGHDKETLSGLGVQPPQPSYSPPQMMSYQYTSNNPPQAEHVYYSQYKRA